MTTRNSSEASWPLCEDRAELLYIQKVQTAFCALILVASFCLGASSTYVLPELIVELGDTAPEQASQIENLDQRRLREAMALTGQHSPGEPIRLVLAPESSEVAKATPGWISGFAVGAQSLAILFPARTPGYPDSNFEELILHEVGHILVFRATGGNEVPRWFNEGLALFVGRPWTLEDRSRVSWALLRRKRTALDELDRLFGMNRAAARHAYALSGAFVQDMIRRHGSDSPARILAGVAAGIPFEVSFDNALGLSLSEAEQSFWSRFTFWYRWLPIISSSATLWIVITGLFLVAARKRRRQTVELIERWNEPDGGPPTSGQDPPVSS